MEKKASLKEFPIRNKSIVNKRPIPFLIVTILFAVYSLLLLFPIWFALNSALKPSDPEYLINITGITTNPAFHNFVRVFSDLTIGDVTYLGMMGNSLWWSFGTTTLSLISSMFLAYGVAKYRFRGRKFIYSFVLVIMVFPIYGTLPARYKLYSDLGFIDSPLLLLAYTGAFDASFLVLYAFFKNVKWEFGESGLIDGASHWRIFLQIMVPMAVPAITALFVTNFIVNWNNYSDVLLYLPENITLSSGMFVFQEKMMRNADHPLFYAGMLISLIPIFAVYIWLQRTIMQLSFDGGLKE